MLRHGKENVMAGFDPMQAAEAAGTAATAGSLGLLGRMVYWAHSGRHPVGLSLLWEVPLAIGMGYIGLGVAEWWDFGPRASYAVTITISYIGPRAIDIGLLYAQRRLGICR